ncbi:conserved hypothetical protein [Candidatus Desulfarcum epimagneticum]|uniref:Mce/MlaD domain-containing protein n=1 Tax=uncultured Desulfobacteraceae bacterium TaxID=218296 RepID=A0A484HK02_9BACT|nr:conserved hypothetical protein [uncultured Desulfobacteraceae bacterium]
MSTFTTEAKVGLFVFIGLAVLGFMAVKVENSAFVKKTAYEVFVYFDSASGLAKDVQVEMAGVEVGRVGAISLDRGKARVGLRIHEEIVLAKDSRAFIRTRGILGDKYVEIEPGASESRIRPGEMIQNVVSPMELDELLLSLGDIMADVKKLSGTLAGVFGNPQGADSMRRIMTNLNALTDTLNRTAQKSHEDVSRLIANMADFSQALNDPDVGETISNIADFSESLAGPNMEKIIANLAAFSQTLKELGEENQGDISETVQNARKASDSLNTLLAELSDVSGSVKSISEKIDSGQGSIGRLINEDDTVESLNTALGGVNRYLSQQDRYRTWLDYTGEYLSDSQDVKSYLTLRLQPREDKHYLFQLVGDPAGRDTVTEFDRTVGGISLSEREVKTERDALKFSAQIAKRYYDLVLRGGFFESTGGLGADYHFFDDRLTLTIEAFDFDSDQNPHLKFKTLYSPFKPLYLSAGFDDFISEEGRESFFIGAGIHFSDEDIKTLISNIPISLK